MKRIALHTCLFLGLIFSCEAVDLTPHRRVSGVEDATGRYYFQDTGKKIGFRIDPKASADGGASRATFAFTDLDTAAMIISKSSATPDMPFQGEGLKKYADLAHAALPGGATNVVLESEVPNPIAINGWTSYEYIFTCNFYGVRLRRSVTFLNYNAKEQWLITISAPVKDYEKTYARSYKILNSIYDMKPGEELKAPGN